MVAFNGFKEGPRGGQCRLGGRAALSLHSLDHACTFHAIGMGMNKKGQERAGRRQAPAMAERASKDLPLIGREGAAC